MRQLPPFDSLLHEDALTWALDELGRRVAFPAVCCFGVTAQQLECIAEVRPTACDSRHNRRYRRHCHGGGTRTLTLERDGTVATGEPIYVPISAEAVPLEWLEPERIIDLLHRSCAAVGRTMAEVSGINVSRSYFPKRYGTDARIVIDFDTNPTPWDTGVLPTPCADDLQVTADLVGRILRVA